MERDSVGQDIWYGLIVDICSEIRVTYFIIISLKSLNKCQKRQCGMIISIHKTLEKTHWKISLNKKYFIYYSRVSVSEGLNTELPIYKLMFGNYDKEVYGQCSYCSCVIEIKKAFRENEFICKMCSKHFQNHDEINSKIHLNWKNNKKYRVFTNL